MATTSESKLSMKLFIDTRAGKVLFAEAENGCVDFLFQILSLHVSNVIRLLKDKGLVNFGCLPNLYESVENLNGTYILSNQRKDNLLKLKSPVGFSSVPFLLLNGTPAQRSVYCCSHCQYTTCFTSDPKAICSICRRYSMSRLLTYSPQPAENETVAGAVGGFVKELVTYMVMDDLVVKPLSTDSISDIIQLLIQFNVKDVGALQQQVVNFGKEEALALLKTSFESKTVLTSVFLQRIKEEK